MDQTQFTHLTERIGTNEVGIRVFEISDSEIAELDTDQINELVARFGTNTMMLLPEKEQQFFEWLREQDPMIWDDLWSGDERPYLVSVAFLPDLLPNRRGFVICDLVEHQNYDFSVENITDEGSIYLDAALEIVKSNGRLRLEQAFIVEAWRALIDQWRFAYIYQAPLNDVKQMIQWLLNEGMLTLEPPTNDDVEDTDQQ